MARNYAKGTFKPTNPAKYVGTKTIQYRSSWEFQFMKFCDENPNVKQWASEAIRIPYKNPITGKHTVYVPDFFIEYYDRNGKSHVELIEIKPENQSFKESVGRNKLNQAAWAVNQAKWEVARAWCKQKGIVFRVVTERDIFAGTKGAGKKR